MTHSPTRYLKCAETARLVRIALKEAFPEITFSIRSKTYSMGASINVSWQDGPTNKQVEAIAKRFAGATFDGMTDYKGGCVHEFKGEVVHFGADFIFCQRAEPCPDLVAKAAACLGKYPWDDAVYYVDRKIASTPHESIRTYCSMMLRNLPAPKFDGRQSPTADAVRLVRTY